MSRLAGLTILLIGDSHMAGGFGARLQQKLEQTGATVIRDGRVGWTSARWINELPSYGPGPADVIVFALGSNDPAAGRPMGRNMQSLKTWARNRSAREVWWVGPPVFANAQLDSRRTTADVVGPTVFGTRYLPSGNVTRVDEGRAPDGVHFTVRGARPWADAVAHTLSTLRAAAFLSSLTPGGAWLQRAVTGD